MWTHGVRTNALVEFVKNITRRSIPIPQPPVGGSPCSRLKKKIDQRYSATLRERNLRINESLVNPLGLVIALFLLSDLKVTK